MKISVKSNKIAGPSQEHILKTFLTVDTLASNKLKFSTTLYLNGRQAGNTYSIRLLSTIIVVCEILQETVSKEIFTYQTILYTLNHWYKQLW